MDVSCKTVVLLVLCASLEVGGNDPDWWKHTVVYQIYPRSYQDSDGDGVGDLKGIESRLNYIKDLGVDTIWLSPIYTSPMADFGYDVADFEDIDPIFGTMSDFDDLLRAIHDRDMYLMMDYIPNHTSDKHKWFIESRKGGDDNPYADYYCWSPGKTLEDGSRAPPNNWLSIFGSSAWEWDDGRQEYYLHQFVVEQPDLNYRNPKVLEEMKAALRFWVEKGVDGFRIDAIGTMFEVEDLSLDEPLSNVEGAASFQYQYLLHPYTHDQPEIHGVVKEWRKLFDEYDAKSGHHTYMVMEIYDPTFVQSMKYYHSGADMPFNFNLIENLNKTCGGACTRKLVDDWLDNMPEGKWPNYVLGNHDQHRITTRKSVLHASALNMLLLTLPGTPTTYYGEELALRDIEVAYKDTQDPWGINMGPEFYQKYSRDPARAPMQWTANRNADFSTAQKPWLPVNPDYSSRNVKAQKSCEKSPLQIYKKTANLRKNPAFRNNEIDYVVINDNIISYVRKDVNVAYLIGLNLGDEASTDDYTTTIGDDVISSGEVMVDSGGVDEEIEAGQYVDLKGIKLEAGDGIVIKLNEQKKEKTEL